MTDNEIDKILKWVECNHENELAISYQASIDLVGTYDVEIVKDALVEDCIDEDKYEEIYDVIFDLRDKLAAKILKLT